VARRIVPREACHVSRRRQQSHQVFVVLAGSRQPSDAACHSKHLANLHSVRVPTPRVVHPSHWRKSHLKQDVVRDGKSWDCRADVPRHAAPLRPHASSVARAAPENTCAWCKQPIRAIKAVKSDSHTSRESTAKNRAAPPARPPRALNEGDIRDAVAARFSRMTLAIAEEGSTAVTCFARRPARPTRASPCADVQQPSSPHQLREDERAARIRVWPNGVLTPHQTHALVRPKHPALALRPNPFPVRDLTSTSSRHRELQ